MILRPMRAEDIPRAVDIAAGLPEAPRWSKTAYARALDSESAPPRVAIVAEDIRGEIVGFLVTTLIPPQSELEILAVVKHAQREGIASSLFSRLLAILRERQITEVMLEVRESNLAARAFYARFQFSEAGRRAGYYAEPKEDAILLHRTVS